MQEGSDSREYIDKATHGNMLGSSMDHDEQDGNCLYFSDQLD